MTTPLALDGWLEFNRIKWGVTPQRVRLKARDGDQPAVDAVFYLNKRGRLCLPLRNPYMALDFRPTAQSAERVGRQWLEVSNALTQAMAERAPFSAIPLPPTIKDVRPWRWAGFTVGVRYTLRLGLPFDLSQAYGSLRTCVRKAEKAAYRCERGARLEHVHLCLQETEDFKGFRHELSLHDLETASALLGSDHFRPYVAYAPDGEPACAGVVLHVPGGEALLWVGGTRPSHRSSGAYQLLQSTIAGELAADGATGWDLAGANIPSVAAAKASLGAELVPYYTVEAFGVKPLARWLRGWWRFQAKRRGPALTAAPPP